MNTQTHTTREQARAVTTATAPGRTSPLQRKPLSGRRGTGTARSESDALPGTARSESDALPWALVSLVVLVLAALMVRATTMSYIGTLATVNNTTSNSVAVAVGTFSIPRVTLAVQNGALTSTNALRINVQLTTDGTNYVTIASGWPSSTNAGSWTLSPTFTNQTISLRIQTVTTNSVTVAGALQY